MIELYTSVMIKKKNIFGHIVAIDDDGGTKPPIYLVEIDDALKDGENDLDWFDEDDLTEILLEPRPEDSEKGQ